MSSEVIPTEVLCDIFHLLCDAPIALHDLNNELHFHEFPWAVGQVSRHWRGVFLSYTHLWTSLSLQPVIYTGDIDYFYEMSRRTAIYLERSGRQPLTIVVSMPCSGTKKFPVGVWGELLLRHLGRWKKANLVLDSENGAALNQLLMHGYAQSLKSLRMSVRNCKTDVFNVFTTAPCLIELDLVLDCHRSARHYPWAQLKKLKIEVSSEEFKHYWNGLWEILFQLENIEELHIISNIFPRYPSSLPIKCLPALRLFGTCLDFVPMFSWFTAPLLEHLHIHGRRTYDLFHNHQPYERELTCLINRSSCHIRQLTLEGCIMEEMCIAMRTLPTVEELSINHPSPIDLIEDITSLAGCVYLPKLEVLKVICLAYYKNRVEDTVTAFSRLLEVRGTQGLHLSSHNILPLKKFVLRLNFKEECPLEVLDMVRDWPSFAQVYITDCFCVFYELQNGRTYETQYGREFERLYGRMFMRQYSRLFEAIW